MAVHKAVKAGRISLIGDKIDPAVADIQWAANTRARQQTRAPGRSAQTGDLLSDGQADPSSATDAGAAPGADKSTPAQSPTPADTGYTEARTRRERAEAEEAEMRTARIRGTMEIGRAHV